MAETVPSASRVDNPPVLLLGGSENAVSCARAFTAAGIPTVVVNGSGSPALRCRGVVPAVVGPELTAESLRSWLAGDGQRWVGSVLVPLSDRALVTVADEYRSLAESFRPILLDPAVVKAMLDKQTTLELAMEACVPAPRQWIPGDDGIEPLLTDLVYPLIVKPRHGFELIALTGAKYLRAETEAELLRHLPVAEQLPSGFVLNEFVVGHDGNLSSYYALRSAEGETLLEFTKTVDRRCPPNKGGATFHRLVDLPETAALGRRFFDHVGVVGLANVEFKEDQRTGELKIIECNHRLTAALALMQNNGIDLAGALYDQALGRSPACTRPPRLEGTLWYPVRDLLSFRMTGDPIRHWARRPWLTSSYPYWRLSDPGPSIGLWTDQTVRRASRALEPLRSRATRR